MDEKYCGGCKTVKPVSEWHKNKRFSDGLGTQCKVCNKAFIKEWRTRPDVKAKERARHHAPHRLAWRHQHEGAPLGRAVIMVNKAKHNAKGHGRNFECDIDVNDVLPQLELGVCSVTGLPFDLTMGKGRRPFGPSLDRKDPTKGYVKGNVQVVVWVYNAARGFWGDDVLKTLVRALVKTYGDPSHEDN